VAEALRALRLMVGISWGADRARTVAALVTATFQMVLAPLRALGLKQLVDGLTAVDRAGAGGAVLLLVAVGVAQRFAIWASLNVRMRLRENTQLHLDARLMALTAGIAGLEHHERPDYQDKVELLRDEREYLANPFNPISWSAASILQMATSIALLQAVHPALMLLPLFGVPGLLATFRAERADADLHEQQAQPRRMARHLLELSTQPAAAKEVRIFGLIGELLRRRRDTTTALERQLTGLELRNTLSTSLGWLVFAAGYVGAVLFTVYLLGQGRATVGAVVLVLSLGSGVNEQLATAAENLSWAVHAHRAIRRLLWLMDYADRSGQQLAPRAPRPVPERLTRGIALQGVSFAYPGTETTVLGDIDLFAPAGSTVAIVGDNGGGKTTLVKLLCRLYEPTTGTITIDGIDLRDLPVEAWRRRISAGFQDFARLSLAARESIGVGDTTQLGSDAAVLAALQRAAAADLTAALPDGLATQLGRDFEGGVDLSQGQWQKVALARAMMRPRPLLLVLDEPTASLDAPTEHALFERFRAAAQQAGADTGAITILVSHRFSTVRMADLILVIAGGRIAERGDHPTLLRAGGVYADLYERQARAYR
jgi:ATP-binding cassette subfamily B protein